MDAVVDSTRERWNRRMKILFQGLKQWNRPVKEEVGCRREKWKGTIQAVVDFSREQWNRQMEVVEQIRLVKDFVECSLDGNSGTS